MEYIKCLPKKKPKNFEKFYEKVPKNILDFMLNCLKFNPENRITI